jgi:hypothetical protein
MVRRRAARRRAKRVVVSIFVNPLQFDRKDDLERYPRTFEADLRICNALGVQLVFAPSVAEMYPAEPLCTITVRRITERLCGQFRPGHFDGVATVVAKLFDIVQPDVIWAGGITACRRIAALAYAAGLPCVPHVYSTAVSIAANLHFMASLPNCYLLEFDQNPNALRTELLTEPIEPDELDVALAVRMSMSIPIFFEPVRFENCCDCLKKFPQIEEMVPEVCLSEYALTARFIVVGPLADSRRARRSPGHLRR